MALFTKKTWKDRKSEYPTRRKLTKENGTTELVTVARSEGSISQEGDAFSASNMNDLENRISKAIGTGDIPTELGTDIISALNALNTGIAGFTNKVFIWADHGSDKLEEDLYNHWVEIGASPSYGNVFIRNGSSYYTGVYVKYNNYHGSILLVDSSGNIHIWRMVSGVHSMHTVAF